MSSADLLVARTAHWMTATPDAIAVECGTDQLTYAELDAAVQTLAGALQQRGVGAGDCVALQLSPSISAVVAMLALGRLRAAYLPLDPHGPAARQQAILKSCTPRLCLTRGAWPHGDLCAAVQPDVLLQASDSSTAIRQPALPEPGDLAYILFTSGSTGTPKGVRITHANLAHLYAGITGFEVDGRDCWSQLHALTFGFAQWEIWGALSHGGRLCIVPPESRADPTQWDPLLRASGATVISLTPSGMRQWLAAARPPLTGPRYLVLSGEALRPAELEGWHRRQTGSDVRLFNTYALTETAGCVASAELTHPAVPAERLGQAVGKAELWVMDPAARRPVAAGNVGELWVAGPMLAEGYHAAPELTAERFIEHDPGDGTLRRFYRSGDQVHVDADGQLSYVGREDDQIKLRGHRIELGEIERVLRSHPDVGDAAVVVTGEAAGQAIVAYATPQQTVAEGELQFWPSLGEYQVYDPLLYDLMGADERRIASYQRAFARQARGRVVLDVGTGQDALLARLCVAAGARHVYAVEVLEEVAAAARRLVAELGLQQRITVLTGSMETVELPEPVDLCTQGIVGNIGSSDGIAPIWNAARQWFAPDCVAVPERCVTLLAPAELPLHADQSPRFSPLAAGYVSRVFASEARTFDVRLCVRNLPASALLADPAEFEQLDFSGELATDSAGATDFSIARGARLDGLVLWTRLHNGDDPVVDFFDHQQAWLPVWFPLETPVDVKTGDRVQAQWRCRTPGGQIFPDYALDVVVQRAGLPAVESHYRSAHHEQRRGQTQLHRELLAGLDRHEAPDTTALRSWLEMRLPDYMWPRELRMLNELPLSVSRKIDRERLRQVAERAAQPGAAQPLMPGLEQTVGAIWCAALDVDAVGPDDHFFDLGGDSISAVRLTTEVQRHLDTTVFLTALYEAPTLRAYCKALEALLAEPPSPAGAAPPADAEPAAPEAAHASLAFAQQSLWFLHQLYPDNTAANEQFVVRMTDVAVARVEAAWAQLVSRHDVLRTGFRAGAGGEPQPFLATGANAAGTQLDLREAADAGAALRDVAAAQIRRPFDLRRPPLLRVVWARVADAEWALVVTAHHLIADGLCVALIRDELLALYEQTALPPPECYADFVAAQQRQVRGEWLAAEQRWWRDRLADVPLEPPAVASIEPDPAGPETRVEFAVPAVCADGLRRLARACGTTLFVVLAAAWRVWVARTRGQPDVLLGTPVTQRTTASTAKMLGCLVNNIPLRNHYAAGMPFTALVRAEHAALLAAREHAALPFEQIVAALDAPRVLGRHPLFQVFLQYEQMPAAAVAADGGVFATDVLPVDRASYWDMELAVRDAGPGQSLQAFFGFRSDLYPAAELRTWPDGLTGLLQAVVAEPERLAGDLPLLSAAQQARREARNATRMAVPEGSLAQLFAAQARRTPAADALHLPDGAAWSYRQLAERAAGYAGALQARGVGVDSRVGLALPVDAECIALLLGINHVGAVWVPLDPDYPPARLTEMQRAAGLDQVIAAAAGLLPAQSVAGVLLETLATEAHTAVSSAAVAAPRVCALFTSGSTGVPKGTWVGQRQVVSRCAWMWSEYGFDRTVRFAQRTSLNFIDALWEIFGPLLHGAAVALPPPGARRDARQLAAWVRSAGVGHLVTVPALLQALLTEWRDAAPPAALQSVISSGEPLTRPLLEQFRTTLADCRLLNTYGTSETWDLTAVRVDELAPAGAVPVGFPVANTRVDVLDAGQRPLPAGAVGEVYAACLQPPAYLDAPALTAGHLVRLPGRTGEWYRTGDLGHLDARGQLYLDGRQDRQLKLRGVRLEPGEVEAVAARHPAVQAAALARTAASQAAGDDGWLTLYVTSEADAVEPGAVREWLQQLLPAAIVPADILVVAELPRTPSGKLDVAALAAAAPEQRPAKVEATPRERRLLDIWQAALGRADISIHDDFFALRGNSLLATRVIARICDEFDVELPLAALFATPTVAGLAHTLEMLEWALDDGRPGAADGEREVVRL